MEAARPSPIRVLLVDDHQLLTDALARLLAAEPDIEIVATARSVAEAVDRSLPVFDVVVMDYLLPDGDGADATRLIKARRPGAKVVFVSVLSDDQVVARATRAGADAYLGKEIAAHALLGAIRQAHNRADAHEAQQAEGSSPHRKPSLAAASGLLTSRELEVLAALTRGSSTRHISTALGIAPNTVRTHVQNVMAKLGVHSRLEAVAIAARDRLV
jgi:DNA-binding NarL/FixJ family response regulator